MTEINKYPTVSFRLTGRMQDDLAERQTAFLDTRHAVAKRDLERYYALLRRELRSVRLSREREEVMLLLDISNGTLWEPHSIPMLWSEVEDSLEDGVAEKWGVDGPAFVKRLRGLTAGQAFAVVDALERAWKLGGDLEGAAREVGLLRGGGNDSEEEQA